MIALYPDTGFGRTFGLGVVTAEILVAMARPGGAIDILGVGSTGRAVRLGHDVSPFCPAHYDCAYSLAMRTYLG